MRNYSPKVKYFYKHIPMIVANSIDIFQQKMNDLFHVFEFIRAYIDDLFVLTKGDWAYHVNNLGLTLNKLKGKGIKCNIEKSLFGKTEMGYLGFYVTRDGVKPINRKIEAITIMNTPTYRKEVQKFIGVINFFRNV